MRRVFVDSGGFFAHLVAEDPWHGSATALFQAARDDGWRLITTNAVIFEAYALFLSRTTAGCRHAMAFLDHIERGLCIVVRVSARDEKRAIALVRAHEDKTYSLCDALSFMVMERLHIREAIAFDRHFREYGRVTIL